MSGTFDEFRSVNVGGTRSVLTAARNQQVLKVVHVSTPAVAHVGEPIVGAGAGPAATGRRGAFYAETKAQAEKLALDADSDQTAVVVVRPHLVWGPGDTQLVGRIVERAAAGRLVLVGRGAALVETTFLDDAAGALVAALDAVEPGAACAGKAYVIAGGEPRTVAELVEGICQAAQVPFAPKNLPLTAALRIGGLFEQLWPRVSSSEPPLTRFIAEQLGTAHWFDPTPARTDLAWQPRVGIDEGLARLAAWFSTSTPTPGRPGG